VFIGKHRETVRPGPDRPAGARPGGGLPSPHIRTADPATGCCDEGNRRFTQEKHSRIRPKAILVHSESEDEMSRKGQPVNVPENSNEQGLPSMVAEPIGEAKSSGLSAFGRSVPGSTSPVPAAESATGRPADRPRQLRIGDRVRSFVDDVCVSVGLTGLVVNVAPPRYGAPARARILWDNETVSMADAHTFEVLVEGEATAAQDDDSRVA
jgi:hypothetical protein